MWEFLCHLEKLSRVNTLASRPTDSDGSVGHFRWLCYIVKYSNTVQLN